MNRKELEKLACEVLHLWLGVAKLASTGNKVVLVERLYLHLQDPSSKPEPEREDVPDTTPESEDSSESSSEGCNNRVNSVHLSTSLPLPFTGSWPPTMQRK
eukprot:Em0342g6a